jgi:hypothetical protein
VTPDFLMLSVAGERTRNHSELRCVGAAAYMYGVMNGLQLNGNWRHSITSSALFRRISLLLQSCPVARQFSLMLGKHISDHILMNQKLIRRAAVSFQDQLAQARENRLIHDGSGRSRRHKRPGRNTRGDPQRQTWREKGHEEVKTAYAN